MGAKSSMSPEQRCGAPPDRTILAAGAGRFRLCITLLSATGVGAGLVKTPVMTYKCSGNKMLKEM